MGLKPPEFRGAAAGVPDFHECQAVDLEGGAKTHRLGPTDNLVSTQWTGTGTSSPNSRSGIASGFGRSQAPPITAATAAKTAPTANATWKPPWRDSSELGSGWAPVHQEETATRTARPSAPPIMKLVLT